MHLASRNLAEDKLIISVQEIFDLTFREGDLGTQRNLKSSNLYYDALDLITEYLADKYRDYEFLDLPDLEKSMSANVSFTYRASNSESQEILLEVTLPFLINHGKRLELIYPQLLPYEISRSQPLLAEAQFLAYTILESKIIDCPQVLSINILSVDCISHELKAYKRDFNDFSLRDFGRENWHRFYSLFKELNPYTPKKLEYLRKLKLPFKPRPGQLEMLKENFTFLRDYSQDLGSTRAAIMEAPTGIGKTLATLFPALIALGNRQLDAIFYATNMIATRTVAQAELTNIREVQAGDIEDSLKSLQLESKFALCRFKNLYCNFKLCPYAKAFYQKLPEALSALNKLSAISPAELIAISDNFELCPHALALEYAKFCHVVIGDYNHIFSPSSRLTEYLASYRKVALLIDEAHNLPNRAREIFSATLKPSNFKSALNFITSTESVKRYNELKRFLNCWLEIYDFFAQRLNNLDNYPQASIFSENPLVTESISDDWLYNEHALACYAFPDKLIPLLSETINVLQQAISDIEDITDHHPFRKLFYHLRNTLLILEEYYDDDYVICFERAGNDSEMELRLQSLGISEQLSRNSLREHPGIFFSATLSPLDFYQSVLFKPQERLLSESYASPFPSENQQILLHTGIDMRFANRSESLEEVINLLDKLSQVRRSNILVFTPSWGYQLQLAKILKDRLKQVDLLVQDREMNSANKANFLAEFKKKRKRSLLALAVLGSNFNEGVDLPGEALEMVVVLSTAHPPLSLENELLRKYYDERYAGQGAYYSYICPAFNRIQQAVGRLIRSATDRGSVILVDSRWSMPAYQALFPEAWQFTVHQKTDDILAAVTQFFEEAIH